MEVTKKYYELINNWTQPLSWTSKKPIQLSSSSFIPKITSPRPKGRYTWAFHVDLAEESRPAWQRFNISESHSYIRNPARRAILETQDNVPNPENMKTDSAYVLIWDVVSYGNLKLLVFFKVEHIPSTV